MSGAEMVARVVRALEGSGIEYMVVGAISSNYWGIPRATKDFDAVVKLESEADLSEIVRLLGDDFEVEAQASFETITWHTRTILRQKGSSYMIGLFDLGEEKFEREKFGRRRRIEVAGVASDLPSPEDVILQKVRWYSSSPVNRSDDRKDARNVMAVQGAESLDWEYLRKWGERHETLGLLEEIRESVAGI